MRREMTSEQKPVLRNLERVARQRVALAARERLLREEMEDLLLQGELREIPISRLAEAAGIRRDSTYDAIRRARVRHAKQNGVVPQLEQLL